MTIVTHQDLDVLNACEDQVALFCQTFPDGAPKTIASLRAALAAGLDLDWYANATLPAPALKTYKEAKATAWKAYEKAKAPAWKAYEEAKATALKAYEEAMAPALKAYKEATAPALIVAFHLTEEDTP